MFHAARLTLAATVAAVLMTGCGTHLNSVAAVKAATTTDAQATQTLIAGFAQVYGAAFARLDSNADGAIDEYEAGPFIDLRDMVKADISKDGKLTKAEFLAFASEEGPFHGWFGFVHQSQDDFVKSERNQMLKAFDKLDTNHDHLLGHAELENGLAGQKLSLAIPGLKLNVTLTKVNGDDFQAADHTGDGSLGQAEFEDFALAGFIHLVNPTAAPAPAPAPSDEPPAPPAPPAPAAE